jgi:hypothetical protein
MLRQTAPGQSNTVVRLKTRSLHLRNRLRSSVIREYPPACIPLAKIELLMPRVDSVIEEANKLGATQVNVVCAPRLLYLLYLRSVTRQVMVEVPAAKGMLQKAFIFSKILEL